MQERLVSFETAKLAGEKGFLKSWADLAYRKDDQKLYSDTGGYTDYPAPTQSLLQKWIRETRGVHIDVYNNASGWLWCMMKTDGGTGLGSSEYSGPNASGCWDSYEEALENALLVQLSYDLPKDAKTIKHWGNYVNFAIK